ncbi:UNVERIFIED_CONTAM: hypothetical protein Sangu_2546300, partial [Sesamum angustifolium]
MCCKSEPTQSHTPLSENFIPHENDAEDPIGDSFANESDDASEPDEAEYPIPPEDGPDDVDINVMAETFAQDSVDVPNLRYAKFYNKFEGRPDVGMLFKTKEELMEAVQDHSVRHARSEYYVTESSKTKWRVLCKHSIEDMWYRWELRGHVKCNPYGIKYVIQNVKDQTGYDVPYQKAWYSLKKAREIVYGTWESSVQKLPKYLGAIQKYNPGTIVEWKHKAFQQSTGSIVLGYVFWAFKPCIDWFQFCRKIISVDDTHLYIKYKHKILIAAAMDGNQQDFCWQAGSEYQLRKFNRIIEEIKKQNVGTFAYLDQINKEKWTASHDGGWRCDILTTNMSECINGVLKGARRPAGARMDMGSTPMLSKLLTENAHAASGINLASLVLTLKKYAVHT